MSYKTILSTKIAVVALGLLLVFFATVKYQQYKAQQAVERQKQILLEQINKQEGKNRELSESLNLLSSADYRERAARQQLNLKKDGELVFNFTEGSQNTFSTQQPESQETKQSNPQKWWNYFFNN